MKIPLFYVAFQTLCWISNAAVISSVRHTETFDHFVGDYNLYQMAQYTFVTTEFCEKAKISLYYSSCQVFALQFDGLKHQQPKKDGNDSISHFYDIKIHSAKNVAHFKNKTQLTVLVKESGEVIANGQSVANVSCPISINRHDDFDRFSATFEKDNICPFQIFVDPFVSPENIYYLKRIENIGYNETEEKNVELEPRSNWKFYLLNFGAILWGFIIGLLIFTVFYFVSPFPKNYKAPKNKIECKSKKTSNKKNKKLTKANKKEPEQSDPKKTQ